MLFGQIEQRAEIKEMLGHETIESSRKYLHIHTDLMREVIVDELL